MPSYLTVVVVRAACEGLTASEQDALIATAREDLARWPVKDLWWGEKGVEGPAALIELGFGNDMLPSLFALSETDFLIARTRMEYRRES